MPITAASASPQALAAVRAAVAATLADTADVALALTGATVFDAARSDAVGSGSFDFRTQAGSISLRPARSRDSEPIVFTPEAVYIRPPSANELLPAGKSWIVDGFSDTPTLTANFPQFVAQVESVNPGLVLSELGWGAALAGNAATDRVLGEEAMRYDVTIDLKRALSAASGPVQRQFYLAIETELASMRGTSEVGARVWVSNGGRVVRVEVKPPGTGLGTTTITLRNFGVTVHAAPPAPAEVVELAAISPSGERENRNGGDSDGG